MPVIIPNRLPAGDTLKKENIFTMRKARAQTQDIRPLRIVIVNLMPTKIATETQLARVLANSPLQVELTLVHMDSHDAKNISQGHLDSFYKTIDEVKHEKFDGMILTGAPVEQIPFEDVDYWSELTEIMEWSKTNVYSTVHICWGAQAALYYHYGVPKYPVDKKVFGIFEQRVVRPLNPLMRGFDEVFFAPHSRHTTIKKEDVQQHKDLRILAESTDSGLHILSNENGRMIFILGHQEYDKETLGTEYFRDVDKGLPIDVPKNYFKNDDPTKEPIFRWRAHASLLFTNWLNYYVYQETPFDLESL